MYSNPYYGNYPQPMGGYSGLYQPQFQPMSQPQTSPITFVEGDAGAQAMQVEPGKSGMAMDLKAMMVYLKSVDPSGIPNTRKFRMVEEVQQPVQNGGSYATMEDLRRTQEELQRLTETVRGLLPKEG